MEFAAMGIRVLFCEKVSYRSKEGEKTVDGTGDDMVSITRNIVKKGSRYLRTRLSIRNRGHEDIFLRDAYPVVAETPEIGSIPSSEWTVLLQKRHKNGLPSVFTPGKRDAAFRDAANQLNEEGVICPRQIDRDTDFHGDQIAVFKGGECYLSLSFLTGSLQTTEYVISVDSHGCCKRLEVGGEFMCLLPPGKEVFTEWIALEAGDDGFQLIDKYAERCRRLHRVKSRSQKPAVYSTWYYYGMDTTPGDIRENLAAIRKKALPFTCFQIDDGWETYYGDWEPRGAFLGEMEALSAEIRQSGLQAGIWTAPFLVDSRSKLFQNHPDWILRHNNGDDCKFKMDGREYHVLDLTHPAIVPFLQTLYQNLTAWGYSYHKLDFTRAFPIQKDCRYSNPYLTPVEAYQNAMAAVRGGMGENAYLLVCGGLYLPLIGIADAQRTGSDVLSMWENPNGNGPKIPFTVKQNVMRYFMNQWWDNDPDALMVRRKTAGLDQRMLKAGYLTDDEAVTFAANQYFSGGLVEASESLREIEEDRLSLLRHILPVVPVHPYPYDAFYGGRFPSKIAVRVKSGWITVCFINWANSSKELEIVLDERLCDPEKRYFVSSFFGGRLIRGAKLGDVYQLGSLKAHGTEIVKIAEERVPQVVFSNMHFSMGGEVEQLQTIDNTLIFCCKNSFEYPAKYVVALPEGCLTQDGENILSFQVPPHSQLHQQIPLFADPKNLEKHHVK